MRLSKVRDIFLTLMIIVGLAVIINWLNSNDKASIEKSTETIAGKVRLIDADSFFVDNKEVRLFGIDAPEGKQFCKGKDDKNYACGRMSTRALQKHLNNRPIKCKIKTWDRYDRAISICFLAGEDLNDWLVRQGYAMAYRKYSNKYINAEKEAKSNRRGLWQGTFTNPSEWRQMN